MIQSSWNHSFLLVKFYRRCLCSYGSTIWQPLPVIVFNAGTIKNKISIFNSSVWIFRPNSNSPCDLSKVAMQLVPEITPLRTGNCLPKTQQLLYFFHPTQNTRCSCNTAANAGPTTIEVFLIDLSKTMRRLSELSTGQFWQLVSKLFYFVAAAKYCSRWPLFSSKLAQLIKPKRWIKEVSHF